MEQATLELWTVVELAEYLRVTPGAILEGLVVDSFGRPVPGPIAIGSGCSARPGVAARGRRMGRSHFQATMRCRCCGGETVRPPRLAAYPPRRAAAAGRRQDRR